MNVGDTVHAKHIKNPQGMVVKTSDQYILYYDRGWLTFNGKLFSPDLDEEVKILDTNHWAGKF